jgi:Tfp pilus assembly protein PilF
MILQLLILFYPTFAYMKEKTELLKTLLHKTWLIWLLIAGITLLIYSETISYGMLNNFDDDAYFSDTRISDLHAANVKMYFSDYYLGMYQPLPVLSFALVNHIAPGSMQAQRIVNLLLHCINILLVLVIIKKITGNLYIGALTAFFFAVHPMHVESVTWISTRSNLMFSAFYLGAVLVYVNWQKKHHVLKWVIIYILFALALFSKVTAVTLPAVLLLIDWYSGRKFTLASVGKYLPMFALSGIFIGVGVQASSAFGHITDMGQTYTFIERIVLFFHALWLYLVKFFIPANQSVIYLFPFKENGILPATYYTTAILALVATALIIFAGLKLRKHETGKAILFGFLFFLITISITMPIKWSRTIIIAERYTYLPYIGLTVALLIFLFGITRRKSERLKTVLTTILIFIGLLFAVLTFQRNKVWENPVTLFTDVIEKNPGKAEVSMGYYNRGNEYFRLQNAEQAISDYTSAIEIYPEYKEAYYNRGLTYYLAGNNASAIADFTRSIAKKNDFTDAYINRAAAYRNTGMYELALSDLDSAILLKPGALAYLSRGVLLYSNFNNPDQACSDWNAAAQLGSGQAVQLLQEYCGRQ